MGSIDKLIKALENLKVFQPDGSEESPSPSSKKKSEPLNNKDKILNCNILADCMCTPSVRSAAEFPNFLGVVIETLLSYANDKESDVRMVSDECVNRITRALLDTNRGRLQVEFFKEFKKNGPSRCVRSALWRFAELAPMIRTHKRRPYVVNLLPCIVKMAERHEEALQECLMTAMPNICSTLMAFAADIEIKSYLAPFISNLCSTSAVVRRVASTCASTIVLHSRKPLQFFSWLLVQVLDMALPVMHSTASDNMPIMLGCLHCIRLIIPLLADTRVVNAELSESTAEQTMKLDTTIMLFELIIHCLQQSHPSVTTSALECLQQLLKTPTLPGFVDLVLTPGSISTSVLAASYEATMAALDHSTASLDRELGLEDNDSQGPLEELQVNLALQAEADLPDTQATLSTSGQDETDVSNADVLSGNSQVSGGKAEENKPAKRSNSTASLDSGKLSSDLIGCLTDPDHPPVLYCGRLLCQCFLLTGNREDRLYADREVRVSIKSLALSCLSYILKMYPHCIEEQLYVSDHAGSNQPMSDILLYHTHLDPQLQGMIAQVLGNLLHARIRCQFNHDGMMRQDIGNYIVMLADLLNTENSMATRLALSAVKTCINALLNSEYQEKGVELLDRVYIHITNNYWLVRVELLELLSEVDMLPLIRLSEPRVQGQILDEVVLRLLGDSDHRVRQAASSALVRLVPSLFYGSDHSLQSVLLARSNRQLNSLIYPFLSQYPIECPPMVHGLPPPYHVAKDNSRSEALKLTVQSSLSKIIYRLLEIFSTTSSQPLKLGVCHALYVLSEAYPVTTYSYAWSCGPGSSCVKKSASTQEKLDTSSARSLKTMMSMEELRVGSGGGPLTLVMSLLTHSPLSLDLGVHQDLLALAGNLLSGACLSALQQGQTDAGNQTEKIWPGVYDRLLVPTADKLLLHLIKLLNIFSHVLEDTSLVTSSNPKAVLDAARVAITSPIKKRVGKDAQSIEAASEPKSAKEAEKVVKSRKETLGTFSHIPYYVKLHESIKGAHLNYKVSLSLSKVDKFGSMLHHMITVFSQLLEVASLQEIGKCAEEILDYLKSIVLASPVATITLVHQLLKALFGTNISSQYDDLVEKKVINRSRDVTSPVSAAPASVIRPGLFTSCLSTPYSELAQSLAHNPFRVESDDFNNAIYLIKKCEERKMPLVLKPTANVDKNTVGVYIRLFEPLVIKALKMYTVNSSVSLQIQVLGLLIQLIQLRVNYCLLDNDEIFFGHILKQVDMISEGPPSEQAGLVRCIFQFLLLLSYEKLHSKALVTVPRIMQLCDGVMASGQNPVTHAIPALETLVKDLFLCRSVNTSANADTAFHDIETQREVTASMLLRLIQHTKVLGLLSVVLYQLMRESEEKWKKLSRQVLDLLLPLTTKQRIELETREDMFALHNILLSVSPSVYRPVDMLLKALFTQPLSLDSRKMQLRWMSSILAIFRVLLSIGKEEVILSRLNELEVVFDTGLMYSSVGGPSSHMTSSHTLSESCESMISSSYGSVQPQELLASFLTQIMAFCTDRLYADLTCTHITEEDYKFSVQQFSLLLLFTSYMLQSGHFRKVARFMMDQLHAENSHIHELVLQINDQMVWIGAYYPTLTLQWSYILILLNYDDQSWWRKILGTRGESDDEEEDGSSMKPPLLLPINEEIIRCTGLAMYCDYVVENVHDAEHLTWLTVNHVSNIIDHLHEAPVHDFMSTVYSNSSASGLFITAIQSRYKMNSAPSKLHNVVTCLRNMHKDQSGSVVLLLVQKMISSSYSGINRLCDSVACRRLEVLLAEDRETVHKQLTSEDLLRILVTLHSNKRKHRRLLSLVEKLCSTYYPSVLPAAGSVSRGSAIPTPPDHTADKEFYLYITKLVCSNSQSSPKLCASLLGSLEKPDILDIMSSDTFQLRCLAECIKHGANTSVRSDTGTVINDVISSQDLAPLLAASEEILKSMWTKLLPLIDSMEEVTSSSLEDSTVASPAPVSVDIVNAVSAYLKSCSQSANKLEESDMRAICGIACSYFDRIKIPLNSMLQSSQMMFSWTFNPEESTHDRTPVEMCQLYSHLCLLSHILRSSKLNSTFSDTPSQVFAVIDSITYILKCLGVSGLTPELENYRESLVISQDGYIQISQLVTCLSDVLLAGKMNLPKSLVKLFNSVIRGLARLPCVNEHARMPVSAFILSSDETRRDNNKPEMRVDALQDSVVLTEFIKRNNILGWISRPQFEETWACLLHLLSPVATTGTLDLTEEDDAENMEWMVSALRGITGLLCHTLNRKEPGNPLYTCYQQEHRNRALQSLQTTPIGEKLYQIRLYLESKCAQGCECMAEVNLFCINTERLNCDIGYNQLSVECITTRLNAVSPRLLSVEKADTEPAEKTSPTKAATGAGSIDTASCLKLLIDVYSHLLSPNANPRTPLMLLNESVKSIVMLSDLFYERSQFDWMYSTLLELHHNHYSAEDELMNQYIILGLCKASAINHVFIFNKTCQVVAVLDKHDKPNYFGSFLTQIMKEDSNAEEKLHKLIETSLKSTHIPTRLAAINGSLYILESGSEREQVKSLLTILIDFLSKTLESLSTKSTLLSEYYSLSVWSLTFYIIEHFQELTKIVPTFTAKSIQVGVQFINNCENNCTPRLCSAILRGCERLLLTKRVAKPEAGMLLRLSSERLSLPTVHMHIHSILGLLVTCMYTDISENVESSKVELSEVKMELVAILFDRIRRGLPQEAEIITGILPTLMSDLFSSQDIMNKVIGEFLSEQQPHPTLIARMVYEVFEAQAAITGGSAILQDWVLLSVTSFTQRNPLSMAIWSLSCFFVSASANHWLRGLFPFIASRIGLLEPVDEMIFVLSCKDFYNSVVNDNHKRQTFISVIQSAARNESIYKTALGAMVSTASEQA